MIGIEFEGSNDNLRAPNGQEDEVYTLPICRIEHQGYPAVISCWQPSDAERKAIAEGGNIFFMCMGVTHPPMLLLGSRDLDHAKAQLAGESE